MKNVRLCLLLSLLLLLFSSVSLVIAYQHRYVTEKQISAGLIIRAHAPFPTQLWFLVIVSIIIIAVIVVSVIYMRRRKQQSPTAIKDREVP